VVEHVEWPPCEHNIAIFYAAAVRRGMVRLTNKGAPYRYATDILGAALP
jgi:hypothetical protein